MGIDPNSPVVTAAMFRLLEVMAEVDRAKGRRPTVHSVYPEAMAAALEAALAEFQRQQGSTLSAVAGFLGGHRS